MLKLRHTPPQNPHEQAIVSEIDKAEASLRRALVLCAKRTASKSEDGQSLRTRYKDTQRSLELALDMMRGIRGFGPLPQVRDTNGKP